MYFKWILLPYRSYVVWQIIRPRRRGPCGGISLLLRRSRHQGKTIEPLLKIGRQLKKISLVEFTSLLNCSDDLFVINLRTNCRHVPFPVSLAHVLFVAPHELAEVLRWLPPNKSVVFYGASEFYIPTQGRHVDTGISVQLYVLEGNFAQWLYE